MPSTTVTTLTAESIDNFRNWSIARGQSFNTAKAYSTDLRMFLEWVASQHQAQLATVELTTFEPLAMRWLNETRAQASPKTTGRRLTSLRAFARWVGQSHLLSDYKAPTPGKPVPHPLPERLEGLERLCEVARTAEQRALIGACGYIGLRVSEARAFHTSWLDTSTMTLRVRGKGDKERFVPVSPRAWSAISVAYVDAMHGDGQLISYQDRSARKAITLMGQRAGLKRAIKSHDLRATFATILSENGVSQRVIQELLGHANGSTTEVYIGVAASAMKGAVDF